MENFEKSANNLIVSTSEFRKEKRELWSKFIVLSSAILGFSVTIFSKELPIAVSICLLKAGWFSFLINIVCGLFLLKKESEFDHTQNLANMLHELDKLGNGFPPKTNEDKDMFLTLTYLQGLRSISEKENFYSQKAKDIFEKNKKKLQSWQLVKNPEKFYSYSHLRFINIGSDIFYGSFVVGIIFLMLAVIF